MEKETQSQPSSSKIREQENDLKFEESFFFGEKLRCLRQPFLAKGDVFKGFWKENGTEKEVAVRMVEISDCHANWKDIVDSHLNGSIKHDNVLKLFGYEEGYDQFRFFALESYDATLEQFCNGQYTGPMPSDAQVLYQIANGINYLHTHSQRIVHGNLNPQTILISQGQAVRMKVSDFGLRKFVEIHKLLPAFKNYYLKKKLTNPEYWMFIVTWTGVDQNGELSIQFNPTVHGDVFAAGCLFFYFLTRGLHPFGDPETILDNMYKKDPVNLNKLDKEHFAYQSIKNLIDEPPIDGTQWLQMAAQTFQTLLPLETNEKTILGVGGFATVFAGTYEGYPVAIKKISIHQINNEINLQREMEQHKKLNHKNVLKLLHIDEDRNPDFKYIVLELCKGTLTQYCDQRTFINEKKKYLEPDRLPRPDVIALYQIAKGLNYIHSRGLVHRDVKPDNILVSRTNPVQLKLSDFGLCKPVSPQGTFSQRSGLKGTINWMAPEMLEKMNVSPEDLPHESIESDTFAAGCVFFYLLTSGSHPFGNPTFVPANICNGNPVTLNAKIAESKEGDQHLQNLYELIGKMIKKKEERIALTEVVKNLTALLPATKRKFKVTERSFPQLSGDCLSRFHPTEPVLACGSDDSSVILLKAANGSIPFSHWRIELEFNRQTGREIRALEWNVNGTQLAAGCWDGTVIVWSYPSGRLLFEEKKHSNWVNLIAWNPFRQDVLATRHGMTGKKLLFWNSRRENGDVEKANHFLTMERQVTILNVAWISANQIAIGFLNGEIEIGEIKEDEGTSQVVKRFTHSESEKKEKTPINGLQWNERTKYLASSSWHDEWIKIWTMDSDQPVHSLEMHSGCWSFDWLRKVKTDNGGAIDSERKDKENFTFACGLDDGSVLIWNPLEEDKADRKRILPQKHSDRVLSLSFSPDGQFLASVDMKNELIIWFTETWLPVFTFPFSRQIDSLKLSWMSTDSSSDPAYKLAVSSKDKVRVVEQL